MTCQICGHAAKVILQKERNVSCGDYFEGKRLYPRNLGLFDLLECQACGFAYFEDAHRWNEKQFRAAIYNEEYHLCDPPFREERPQKLAVWLGPLLGRRSLIDFGGGEGRLAELLVERGVDARSYDPFYGDAHWPQGVFDVVTAFEVVEHVPDQQWLFRALKSLCRPDGIIVFSTLLKDTNLTGDWWYASARNGHVSFHSQDSLRRLMAAHDLACISLSPELHIAAPKADSLAAPSDWEPVAINDIPQYRFSTRIGFPSHLRPVHGPR